MIRIFLLVLVIVLVLSSVGYKYHEWNTINGLSNLYNSSWKQEFKTVESGNKKSDDFLKFSDEVFGEKYTNDNFFKQYSELKGKLNLSIENQEEYIRLLNQNKDKYKAMKSASTILVGSQGDFAKKLINFQIEYLDNEIENANRYLANLYLQVGLFDVFHDKGITENYDAAITANKNNLIKNFSDISSIQSYTTSDFKFSHEEDIKKYFPDGYSALKKYKDYLSTYYLVVQDIVNGDLDSASYKYTDISNNVASLTLNYNGLFSTGDDQRISRDKDIVSAVSNGAELIKQFKKNNLGKYPLLKEIKTWKEDLVLCEMYNFKSGTIYKSVTSKYPSSKNFDDLLNELSSVNPKTDFVDKDFDKSVVNFINDDKKIEFQCKDKIDGDTLTFSFKKS